MKRPSLSLKAIKAFASVTLLVGQTAFAQNGGGAAGKTNNGNTFDCTRNANLCTGNGGNGVGNNGPGNQGNDGTNGNTGGGTTNGGSTNGHANGGSTNGNSNGNSNGGSTNGHANGGSTNGNSNGNSNGGSTNGHANGGSTNGHVNGGSTNGHVNGGSTNGTANGGSTNGNSNGNSNGGSTNGHANGGSTNGNSNGNSNGGSTNGHANGGSTNGNSNGNSNGGSTNGNSNGNSNGGSTNGHANGGSTNGSSNGNSNGGSTNGNANGGSTNGNSNGNSNGGSTNGHVNGGSTNGNANGGSTNGHVNGGSTNGNANGGSTNGNANGGSTNGNANGGSTNGNANGGSTNGNANGGSTNGNANGGSTNGTADGGSTNGNTNGNSNGGSTNGTANGGSTNGTADGGSTNGPSDGEPKPVESAPVAKVEEKAKRTLKLKIDPLFYLDYDFGAGIVAVKRDVRQEIPPTMPPAPAPALAALGLKTTNRIAQIPEMRTDKSEAMKLQVVSDASVYLKTSFEILEGGVGAAAGLYFENATGLASTFWSMIGIMPMKGTEISSVRYFKTLNEAKKGEGYRSAPLNVNDLYSWEAGESVSYKSKGGVIYLGGLGFGLAGMNTSKLAQGSWETYVEKVDARHVFVKITKGQIDSLSVGTGAFLTSVGVQTFANSDEGFSYLINIQQEEARKVYQDLVRGNVAAAQVAVGKANSVLYVGVQKVESFKRVSKGKGRSLFFGVPILLNAASSESKIQTISTSDLHVDNNKIDAQFGIYDFTTQTRAFGTHTTKSRGFYGVRYMVADLQTKALKETGELGRFSWMYQDDNSSFRTINRSMEDLMMQTGLTSLRVMVPSIASEIDFSNISLNITFSAENAQNVATRMSRMSKQNIRSWADERSKYAFAKFGNGLCSSSTNESANCQESVISQTRYAVSKMEDALALMNNSWTDNASYTKAFAEFGRAAMTNQVSLQIALGLAGEGVKVGFAVEGSTINPLRMNLETTSEEGKFRQVDDRSVETDQSLDPQYKRSRFHGLISNRNLTGLYSPVK